MASVLHKIKIIYLSEACTRCGKRLDDGFFLIAYENHDVRNLHRSILSDSLSGRDSGQNGSFCCPYETG